ncbi:MAG: apolipoprotein N-acyltransferase [Actinobacteria bacterium]|nr:apolipoprotein N-acyltransferase [Actinomycetota bacterium]
MNEFPKAMLFKVAFSLLSSLLLFLCLVDLGFLAWFSLLPLLFSLHKSTLRQSLLYTFLCGLTYFMGITYWVARIFIRPWVVLSLYLTVGFLFFGVVTHFVLSKVSFPYLRILIVSGAWVLVEFGRSFTALAFPIGLLGDSQYSFLPLMQLSKWTGIWGVSLLVALFNMAIFETIVGLVKSIGDYKQPTAEINGSVNNNSVNNNSTSNNHTVNHPVYRPIRNSILLPFRYPAVVGVVILIVIISGIPVLNGNLHRVIKNKNLKEIKLSIVQPNIPLGEKYIHGSGVLIPEPYSSDKYFMDGTELVIFPESILWGWVDEEENVEFKQWAKETLSKESLYLLIGQVVPVEDPSSYKKDLYKKARESEETEEVGPTEHEATEHETKERGRFYNSVLFYDPYMNLIGQYNEIHPVPFTQYIPYPNVLKILSFIDYTVVDIIPGNDYTPFYFPGKGKIGINICFESTIPRISRNFRKNGAQVIIIISDQASCFDTRAPWYSFNINARTRAIENGCYVVQCANTGISGIISPAGEVIASSQLLSKEVLYGSIFLMPGKTFYSKFGDLVMYVYWGVTFVLGCCYLCRPGSKKFF